MKTSLAGTSPIKGFLIFLICMPLVMATAQEPEVIEYFQPATIPTDWNNLNQDTLVFEDTVSGDTLLQIRLSGGHPVFYARHVYTNVCFDHKCRPLNITVYWNITGRYLGFKLPPGEFLSRSDHEPFQTEDYIQLNTLLADPHSPLGDLSWEAIIQSSSMLSDTLDGITGATSREISAFVIEGAAYTTHTLWNIVYGSTQKAVMNLTTLEMTPELMTLILSSPSVSDRIWGIRNIDEHIVFDQSLEEALLDVIGSEDFFAAYAATKAIRPTQLTSTSLQMGLLAKYEEVGHSLRTEILTKLKEAPELSPEIIKVFRSMLGSLNGTQLGHLLDLFESHGIQDLASCRAIEKLLHSNNKFVAELAYRYLVDLPSSNEQIRQAIRNYEQQGKH